MGEEPCLYRNKEKNNRRLFIRKCASKKRMKYMFKGIEIKINKKEKPPLV